MAKPKYGILNGSSRIYKNHAFLPNKKYIAKIFQFSVRIAC